MTRSFVFLPVVLAGALAAQSFEDEFRRGLLALSGNDLAQARQSLENASRAKPDNAMVWAALAQTYLRGHESTLANEAAGRASRLSTADSPVNHALAMFYSETGDFTKAADAERQFASSKGADAESASSAASLSLRAGERDQALRWARTAVERDPHKEAFAFDLGQMQLRSGDFAGAAATLEKACQRFPDSAQLQLAFGVAAYGQRRFADAIDAFLRVTMIDRAVEQP